MTTQVLTNAEKIRRLPWNTAINAANNIFAQLTYFGPAFVLFLNEFNFSNTQIGFLLSLLPFTGLVALLIAPSVARFGYKRVFVTFFGLRKIITAGLLFSPWVLANFGPNALLIYISVIIAGFALSRAIAETAFYPWAQEFIPDSMRGKHAAINDIAGRLTAMASVSVASFVLGLSAGIDRFILLFGIGIVFGLAAVWSAAHLPGGDGIRKTEGRKSVSYRDYLGALRDRNFLLYMGGLCIVAIGTTPMGSFIPLYLEREVGLSESRIVLLQLGGLIGGLSSTYLFGWASDRYGSKPIMLTGLYIKVLLPLFWLLTPRESQLSLPVVLMISLINGSADIAWALGSGRLLYVKVVPQEKRSEYMALYYALIGVISGASQFFGGRALDMTQGLTGQIGFITIDPFFPLFVFAFVLTIAGVLILSRVQADSPFSIGEFAGMFTHGNPILALESMFRYYRARDEKQMVVVTERMAQSKSPLTVDELLEALKDPRFNVRFEAIISIAHMEADPRLTEALCKIVEGTELSLSVIAAWALGRIGDDDIDIIDTLRRGLDSPYKSIQAHCARSLGTLGDRASSRKLLERLRSENDKGLRIAYSSALGKLQALDSVPALFDVLVYTENEGARLELALALVRIIGYEHHFIRLLRNYRHDCGTTGAQALALVKRRMRLNGDPLGAIITECEQAFARNELERAASLLVNVIEALPPDFHVAITRQVLKECAGCLKVYQNQRHEYILLALHTLDAAVV
jgi:Na+/melibiose symporter-like transporter